MNDATTAIIDRDDERERVRAAFEGGGSVMYSGKIISRREDLPDDHPARWDEDELERIEAALEGGVNDSLTLARIVELESWLKQRDATIDALEATNDQLQAALDAMRDERDTAVETAKTLQEQLGAKSVTTPASPPAPVSTAPTASTPPATAPTASPSPAPPSVAPAAPVGGAVPAAPPANAPTSADTSAGTPLPLDFPKRSDLVAANLSTVEALKAVAPTDLTQISGIGPAAATAITERLAAL